MPVLRGPTGSVSVEAGWKPLCAQQSGPLLWLSCFAVYSPPGSSEASQWSVTGSSACIENLSQDCLCEILSLAVSLPGGRRARMGRLPTGSTPAERRLKPRVRLANRRGRRPCRPAGRGPRHGSRKDHHRGDDRLHRRALIRRSRRRRLPRRRSSRVGRRRRKHERNRRNLDVRVDRCARMVSRDAQASVDAASPVAPWWWTRVDMTNAPMRAGTQAMAIVVHRDQGVIGRSSRSPSTTRSTRSLKKATRSRTSVASRRGSG